MFTERLGNLVAPDCQLKEALQGVIAPCEMENLGVWNCFWLLWECGCWYGHVDVVVVWACGCCGGMGMWMLVSVCRCRYEHVVVGMGMRLCSGNTCLCVRWTIKCWFTFVNDVDIFYNPSEDGLRSMFTSPTGDEDEEEEEEKEKLLGAAAEPKGKTHPLLPSSVFDNLPQFSSQQVTIVPSWSLTEAGVSKCQWSGANEPSTQRTCPSRWLLRSSWWVDWASL